MKTLLVCTDFSTTGNNAVKYAIQYAASTKCNLVVFHVVRMPKVNPTISDAAFRELVRKEETIQKTKLENAVDKFYRDLKLKRNARAVKVAAQNGIFVTETLAAAARDFKADLIIVGTHGASGSKVFGSISAEIIFKAKVPVLAIPPRYRYKKIRTIVYASDLKNLVNELHYLVPIAGTMKGRIEILNLESGPGIEKSNIDENDLRKQVNYNKLKLVVRKEPQALTIVERLHLYLKRHRPEVLVMFPEERSFFDVLFVRSKTERLVYDIKIPLLSILKSRVKYS